VGALDSSIKDDRKELKNRIIVGCLHQKTISDLEKRDGGEQPRDPQHQVKSPWKPYHYHPYLASEGRSISSNMSTRAVNASEKQSAELQESVVQ